MLCLNPITINVNQSDERKVACGKCSVCVKRRVAMWSFRLDKQAEVSSSALFVTLTYNNEHLPFSPRGHMTLCKEDLQKFFKRLRKLSREKIKYYACGEYGARTSRPHYHIILFNSNHVDVVKAWALDNKALGHVNFREADINAIGYTLKYISKERRVGNHHLDDRIKEFAVMSKGLGRNYITPEIIGWHQADLLNRMYCPLKDGKKAPMARYYKESIYEPEQIEEIGYHLYKKGQEVFLEELEKYGNDLPKVKRERFVVAQMKMYENAKRRTAV